MNKDKKLIKTEDYMCGIKRVVKRFLLLAPKFTRRVLQLSVMPSFTGKRFSLIMIVWQFVIFSKTTLFSIILSEVLIRLQFKTSMTSVDYYIPRQM